ncbi:hypothetical protein J2X02_000528 [Pseudoxanthomonas japonensis]|uniref:hypothetical protein n=1 Tax=Pseudoxanthomonas TaxID=83618 RepID=UPI0007839F55|nr:MULTISPECIES: hypothetical protein [Pseudoxanthomonas]MDR7067711.1 hypothetical protein [Pseudoxanthomonas japonensis]
MLRAACFVPALALCLPLSATAQEARPDLAALIECRGDLGQLTAIAPLLEDPLKAVALGWQPLPQANMFMSEYRLLAPVRVFGHDTDHIAFSGGGVVAVLDLPDPRPLAKQLELETAVDTPAKAMFGKEVRSEEIRDPASGKMLIDSAVLNVSNVSSHPGKTLAGCSYSLDLPGDEDEAEGGDEAPTPAPVSQPG